MPRQLAEAQPPLRADPDPLPPSCLLILGLFSFFSALLPLHRLLWNVITPLGNPPYAQQPNPPDRGIRLSFFLSFFLLLLFLLLFFLSLPWIRLLLPRFLSLFFFFLLLLYAAFGHCGDRIELLGWFCWGRGRWNRVCGGKGILFVGDWLRCVRTIDESLGERDYLSLEYSFIRNFFQTRQTIKKNVTCFMQAGKKMWINLVLCNKIWIEICISSQREKKCCVSFCRGCTNGCLSIRFATERNCRSLCKWVKRWFKFLFARGEWLDARETLDKNYYVCFVSVSLSLYNTSHNIL